VTDDAFGFQYGVGLGVLSEVVRTALDLGVFAYIPEESVVP
jgi:hypothetical protein